MAALILVDEQEYACFVKCDVVVQLVNIHELVDEDRVESVCGTVPDFVVNVVLERLDEDGLDEDLGAVARGGDGVERPEDGVGDVLVQRLDAGLDALCEVGVVLEDVLEVLGALGQLDEQPEHDAGVVLELAQFGQHLLRQEVDQVLLDHVLLELLLRQQRDQVFEDRLHVLVRQPPVAQRERLLLDVELFVRLEVVGFVFRVDE